MRIRSCLPLSAAVLLAACFNSPAHDGAVTADATIPMLPVDAAAGRCHPGHGPGRRQWRCEPDLGTIFSGTDVVWEKRGTTPFMLKFKQSPGAPSAGWAPGEPGRFLVVDTSQAVSFERLGRRPGGQAAHQDGDGPPRPSTTGVATTVDGVDPGIKILPQVRAPGSRSSSTPTASGQHVQAQCPAHWREAAAVFRAGTMLAQRRQVRRGGVALVLVEAILGMAIVQGGHVAVAGDLGQDRSGR